MDITNKDRFKANMRAIEIEPHSYCNRKCWFCPNSFIDRQFKPVRFLDWAIYLQVLRDLQKIDYSGTMCFAGWCEPFSQENTLEYIKYASIFIPKAFLTANTNTDYLDMENIEKIADTGLTVLRCQLYFDKDEAYNSEAIRAKMNKLGEKLKDLVFIEGVKDQWFALVKGKMVVHVYSKDFTVRGYNRCDLNIKKKITRTHACSEPIAGFGINHNGMAVPCCQIRSDYTPHKDFLLGQMDNSQGKIFDLYDGLILPEAEYPCSTCGFKDTHANPKIIYDKILKELKNGKQNRSSVNRCGQGSSCKV